MFALLVRARYHLDGLRQAAPAQGATVNSGSASTKIAAEEPDTKRPKSAKSVIRELTEAKALKDAGIIDSPDLKKLNGDLLNSALRRSLWFARCH